MYRQVDIESEMIDIEAHQPEQEWTTDRAAPLAAYEPSTGELCNWSNKTGPTLVGLRPGKTLLVFAGPLHISAIANQSQQHGHNGPADPIHIK
jgi:hypothetical protein